MDEFRLPRHLILDLCAELRVRLELSTKRFMLSPYYCKSWWLSGFIPLGIFKLYFLYSIINLAIVKDIHLAKNQLFIWRKINYCLKA